MKIFLTGASSDIGLKLIEKLVKNMQFFSEIILIDNSNSILEKIKVNDQKKIKYIKQNLLHPFSDELKMILGKIDILIHIAWIRPGNPRKSVLLNNKALDNILENFNKNSKVIFLSSAAGIPESTSCYGKSKFEISKRLYKNFETSVLVSGLIVSDSKKSPYNFIKQMYKKILFLIKFGDKVEVLFIESNQVVNAIFEGIKNFNKGIFGLYNNERVLLDNFAVSNFYLKRKIYINISFLINFILFIAKYINYIPLLNKLSDKLLTLLTNDKLKTDKFVKKGF